MGNSLPDLLGDERHEWVKKPKRVIHHVNQNFDARFPLRRIRAAPVKAGFTSSMYQSQNSCQMKW